MFRVDSPDNKFTEGDALKGIPPTRPSFKWFHSVQWELAVAILRAGIKLDGNDSTQLSQAIERIKESSPRKKLIESFKFDFPKSFGPWSGRSALPHDLPGFALRLEEGDSVTWQAVFSSPNSGVETQFVSADFDYDSRTWKLCCSKLKNLNELESPEWVASNQELTSRVMSWPSGFNLSAFLSLPREFILRLIIVFPVVFLMSAYYGWSQHRKKGKLKPDDARIYLFRNSLNREHLWIHSVRKFNRASICLC